MVAGLAISHGQLLFVLPVYRVELADFKQIAAERVIGCKICRFSERGSNLLTPRDILVS
jgi:hypothetical protein